MPCIKGGRPETPKVLSEIGILDIGTNSNSVESEISHLIGTSEQS